MKINSIYLENYRSHKQSKYIFSEGINLILGRNGRGKTSILEAIGYALFNIAGRNGSDVGKPYIKKGENNCKVEIDFTAVDGNRYIVTRIDGKKREHKIACLDNNEEYTENITDILCKLCGLDFNSKEMFENIIVAKQNEFIEIFKKTPSERAKVFDKVFDTYIYKDMSDGFIKDIKNNYEALLTKENSKYNTINSFIKDDEKLNKELKNFESNLLTTQENLKSIDDKKNAVQLNLNSLNETKRNIDIYTEKYNSEFSNFTEKKRTAKQYLKIALESKKSVAIVSENHTKYLEYLEKEKEINKLQKEITLKEEIIEKNQKIKDENTEIEKKLTELRTKLKSLDEESKINYEQSLNFLENIDKERLNINYLQKNIEDYKKTISESKIYEKLERLEELNREIILLSELNNRMKNDIDFFDIEKIKKDIFNLENKLKEIEILEYELKEKIKEKNICEESLRLINNQMKYFSNSICPIFSEECKNIEGKDFAAYFLNEKNKYNESLEKINGEIEKLELQTSEKDSFISLKNKLINDMQTAEENTKKMSINLEKIKDKQEIKNAIDEMIVNNFKNLGVASIKDLENIILSNENKIENSPIKIHIKNLNERIKSIKDNFNKINEINQNIYFFNCHIEENVKKIDVDGVKNIGELKEKHNFLNEDIQKISDSRNLYIMHKKSSEDYNENLENFILKMKERKHSRISLTEIESKWNEYKKNYDEDVFKNLTKELENFNLQREYILKEEENIKTKINYQLREIEENKKKISERLDSEKNIRELETKINFTDTLQKKLRNMGSQVASYMLINICNIASLNFNKITGRTEKISWNNSEKNKYEISLLGMDKEISFKDLSGGEQVSVAISMRCAMSDMFTNSRFIILDEPTNNLDTDRKKMLAEYIGELLNNLDQSIIVTHDDTFIEMASNVIEL